MLGLLATCYSYYRYYRLHLFLLLKLLLLSLLDVEGGWWRSGYTLFCLIMLMLQLTHHANHTVDGSHTSHVTLVAHTIYASHAGQNTLLTQIMQLTLFILVILSWLLALFMLVFFSYWLVSYRSSLVI